MVKLKLSYEDEGLNSQEKGDLICSKGLIQYIIYICKQIILQTKKTQKYKISPTLTRWRNVHKNENVWIFIFMYKCLHTCILWVYIHFLVSVDFYMMPHQS